MTSIFIIVCLATRYAIERDEEEGEKVDCQERLETNKNTCKFSRLICRLLTITSHCGAAQTSRFNQYLLFFGYSGLGCVRMFEYLDDFVVLLRVDLELKVGDFA